MNELKTWLKVFGIVVLLLVVVGVLAPDRKPTITAKRAIVATETVQPPVTTTPTAEPVTPERAPPEPKPTEPVKTDPLAGKSDVEKLQGLGWIVVNMKGATDYDISFWNGSLDLRVPTLFPGEAEKLANSVCELSQKTLSLEKMWQLRVFILVNNDQPAAVCYLKNLSDVP
jgi:hypothetical protein